MNKSEKWLEIAEAYLTPYKERNDFQIYVTGLGLCFSCLLYKLEFDHYAFYNEIIYCPVRCQFFLSDLKFDQINDKWRGMFALLMSEAVQTERGW